ncbi:MAG: Cof-type HAD-IIB family hydrolase [Ruminococcus sp.]|nr:Cof-type HAD-IIB family hydrolase [Ruminococcus sp.]
MFEDISKIIFITDMDGTFLPTNKIPSKKNLEAVKKFQELGGRFSIATGRGLQAAQQYFESFTIDFPIVLCNGGLVYDLNNKKSIYDVFLPEISKNYAEEIFDEFDSLGGEVLTIDHVNIPESRFTPTEVRHVEICKVKPNFVDTLDDISDDWYKVLFCDTIENIDKVIEFVKSKNYVNVDFVRSAPIYYEMLPQNITKGSAITKIRELCDINDCVIVAAGDFNNDIEMLKNADFSFCPSNSTDDVKSVCDVVLENSCDEDAIAVAIEYIISKSNNSSEV